MSYEAWRISFQSSEQAAMAAYGSVLALQSRMAELEKDAARYQGAARLIEKWRSIADEHGVRQFTGNDHLLFANELEVAMGREA